MAQYFIRTAATPEHLQDDAHRGYSFHALYEDRNDALEDMEYYSHLSEDDLAQNSDGRWGFALSGLCGFEIDEDDLENIEVYLANFSRYDFSGFVGVYEGSHAGFVDDGELFTPYRLIRVVDNNVVVA